MDSDPSLFEYSVDDDSQLPRISELDTAASDLCSSSRFTSSINGLNVGADPSNPSFSSFVDDINKDNVSTSKTEVQNLNMEPLPMKRKKTGGFNLRKSLAWNKAFFTDEGVLDPMELSIISGTFANMSGGGLCSIEERRSPQSSNSRQNVSSSSLKSIKKNLVKAINASSSKEDRGKSSCKVFATRNGRTSSMGGVCPRPLFSTSLKRPANINVIKATIKESKLPKFQVSKTGSCSATTTSNSTMPDASSLQNKEISDKVSIQRKYGLRSSSRNERHGQKKSNDDSIFPPDLPLACHLKGDADESTRNLIVSNTSSLLPIRKNGNTSSKVAPDPLVAYSSVCSSQSRDASVQSAVSHLQNSFTSVRNAQHSQIQTMKPSGLRKPSPSLGFFRQSKASEAHLLSQRNAEASVETLQETGDLRPLCAMEDQRINDSTTTMNARDNNIRTTLECSGESTCLHSLKSCSGDDDALKNKLQILYDSKNPKLASGKDGEHSLCSVDGNVNDIESQINGKELLDTGQCGQTFEEDPKVIGSRGCRSSSESDLEDHQFMSHKNCTMLAMDTFTVNNSAEVNMTSNSVVSIEGSFSDFGSENMHICGGENTISNSPVSDMQEVHCLFEEQSEKKSHAFEADKIFNAHNHAMVTENCLSNLSREFWNHGSQDPVDLIVKGLTSTKVETENLAFPVEGLHILSSEENVTRKEGRDKSDSGDSVLHTLNDITSAQSCKNTIHECLLTNIDLDSQNSQCALVLHFDDSFTEGDIKADEERVSKTVSSIELNGKDATHFDGLDVQSAQTIAENDNDMIAGQAFHDDVLLHPAQDPNSFESPDVLVKVSPRLKFALSCNETLKFVVSGIPKSLNVSMELNKEECVSEDDYPAKEREKCSDFLNKGSTTVQLNDIELLEDSQKCILVTTSENLDQKNHSKNMTNGLSKGLLAGAEHSQSLDGRTPAEFCNNLSLSSLSVHHCSAISADKLEQSDMPELERNQNLGSVAELSDVCGREAVSSIAFNLEPPMGETDARKDSFDVDSSIDDKSLGYGGNNSSPEDCELLANSLLVFGIEHNGKSASVDIDSAPQTSNSYISRASTACIGLAESDHGVYLQDQNILGNESEMRTSITINSHDASELCLELDNAKCFTNNENDVVSNKKPEDGKKKSNLSIILPRNAVPFSDEWLIAIEAAGEDVLTMKGGAVQNSPPDKSLPEPGPWSPVRRKNNEIGPYDCTKFTRNKGGTADSPPN